MGELADYFQSLQTAVCAGLESHEIQSRFRQDQWEKVHVGFGLTCVLENGAVYEKAGVNFSQVQGKSLPVAASEKYPALANTPFTAMGVSVVIHPKNPFVPTAHMNVRYFEAKKTSGEKVWWFGGGYDLTPYYGFEEDCVHWHQVAKKTCDAFNPSFYSTFKKNADDYFYLKHRDEPRGIGGLFFDDFNQPGFEKSFAFVQAVGNSFNEAYLPIVNKRKNTPYEKKQRDFQCYRRGRYVEFNLLQDRGTLFGLRFGGRIESILMSLPPVVHWQYDFQVEKDSKEDKLGSYFLNKKDWR